MHLPFPLSLNLAILTLSLTSFVPANAQFQCKTTLSSTSYDLTALAGVKEISKQTETPPTISEARVRLELCGDGLELGDGAEEDQVRGAFSWGSVVRVDWDGCWTWFGRGAVICRSR
jgi:hypothetical protein